MTTDTNSNQSFTTRTRDAATHAFDSTRKRTSAAMGRTRETASHAYDTTRDGVDSNPLSVLVGGLAVGVAVGALLPRTEQESRILGPVGRRMSEGALAAMRAAREAGKEEISSLLPARDDAKQKAGAAFERVVQAAKDGAKPA